MEHVSIRNPARMLEQPIPPSIPQPQEPTDSLFLAIFPDASACAQIESLAQEFHAKLGLRGKLLAPERFHITLHFLGRHCGVPDDIVQSINLACTAVTAAMSPFEVRFDLAGSFTDKPGSRPCALRDSADSPALREVHRRLGEELVKCGVKHDQKFTPHLTLFYDRKSVPEEPVDPVSWKVSEFVLVHSLQGQTRYIPLARWSLAG